MSKQQKDIFINGEGDSWYNRNKDLIESDNYDHDYLLKDLLNYIEKLGIAAPSILEIGCGNGKRLKALKDVGCQVSGLDPSKQAIDSAKSKGIDAKVGTADLLDFEENKFDIVVFGFCLYLCDREDLFKIASEADRVLKSTGTVTILDFHSKSHVFNEYSHLEGLKSYKMDYSNLFSWHPNYTLISQKIGDHKDFSLTDEIDDFVAISFLRKKI